ncbi:MAG: HIT family protein [Thermoplasmata archaeon]
MILYRTDRVTAFLDHRPLGTGHTLVISNAHYSDIFDVDSQTLAEAVAVAKRVASTINSTFHPLGINIIQNNGYHAGQTIFHFHIHIIPRYDESYSNLLSKIAEGRRVVDPSILEEVGRRMQKSL